jgi:outer membrane protein OmpA-like peptidoglycan-associated protein
MTLSPWRTRISSLGLAAGLLASAPSWAQGYQLQRYEPTPAGEGFWSVQAPDYAEAPKLSAGLTLNHGNQPLLGGVYDRTRNFLSLKSIIDQQVVTHADLSLTFARRFELSASLPFTVMERGSPGFGVVPLSGGAMGDPRFGAMMRVAGERTGLFLDVGGALWVPVGASTLHAGDRAARGLVRLAFGHRSDEGWVWAMNGGVLLRPRAQLTSASTTEAIADDELQVGAALGRRFLEGRAMLGPEVNLATGLAPQRAFLVNTTHLEVLFGGQYRLTRSLQLGPAFGVGVIRSPGTPRFRTLFRASYAFDLDGRPASHAMPPQAPVFVQAPAPVEPMPATSALSPEPQRVDTPAPVPEPVQVATLQPAPAAPPPPDAVLHFSPDGYTLSPAQRDSLARIVREMRLAPGKRLLIEGHGDAAGPERWTQTVARWRARNVRHFFVDQGIAPDRIEVLAHGARVPLASNDTRGGRKSNRRVELRVRLP